MTYYGWPSLCLKVDDLEESKRFYSSMGMQVVSEVEGKTVLLRYGIFRLALMTFLDENLLNFRCGNVRQIYSDFKESFPDLPGEPEDYTREQYDATADGSCWATQDPDGNEIFFDTNDLEREPGYVRTRSIEILQDVVAELELLGADAGLVDELREKVIDPYVARG